MSNNKQSSVEWLIEQLKEYDFSEEDDTYVIKIQSWVLTEKHEQARLMHQDEIEAAAIISSAEESTSEAYKKEIHRQQILEAYKKGWEECINSKYLPVTYYNETFGE